MNKVILFVGIVLLTAAAVMALVGLALAIQPPQMLHAEYFNHNAYIVDKALPANSVHDFSAEGVILTGCVFEWLPDGRSLLVVTPPELTTCLEASR